MSFATANVRRSTCGDLKITAGDWSGSAGDANGTVTVEGGRIYFARFDSQDSANGPDQENPVFVTSTSGATSTLSIGNRQTVVTGRFLIISA